MKPITVVLIAAALAAPCPALADECGNAVTDYNAVLVHVQDATQRFSTCVGESLGVNACSKEFNGLRLAYGEFQSAVAIYIKQCR